MPNSNGLVEDEEEEERISMLSWYIFTASE